MSITGRGYYVVGRALFDSKPTNSGTVYYEDQLSQWTVTCMTVSEALAQDNPRFNRDIFESVCRTGHS